MSVVDICNSALNMVGASQIVSLTEDSKAARVCNQRYVNVRDAVFRSHPWNCLITRQELAPDTETPAFEWSYQFTLPPTCLRILQLEYLDTVFRVEGRKILANESTVNVIFVRKEENTVLYDSLLTETLAARLAHEICYPLVASATLTRQFFELYQSKLSEARFVDATEGTPASLDQVSDTGSIEANTFIASRY